MKKSIQFAGGRWERKDLTYKISKYTEQLSKSQIDQTVERAFGMWSEVTPLKFRRVKSGSVSLIIYYNAN